MEDGKSVITGTAYTVIQRMTDGKMSTDVLNLTQEEFESLVEKNSGGFHNEQKYVPFTQEEAEKRVEVGEALVGKGSVRTEGFDKSVAFLMSLMEQIWQVSQQHKSFRMELFYNAETLKTNYCFYAPTDRPVSDGIHPGFSDS